LSIALILVIADMLIYAKKKRRIKTNGLFHKLEILGKHRFLKSLQDKPGSKNYKKIQNDLKKANIKLTPEGFYVTTYLLPLITAITLIVINYTNALNTLLNIEQIKEVAEKLGNPQMAEVSFKINWPVIIVAALIGNMMPRWILKIIISIRRSLSEKEVLMLQTYAIMMLKSGRPVKEILISLYERSKAFRDPLELAVNTYSADPNEALQELKDTVPNESFAKICVALEQTLNNDRKISLTYLENHRVLGKEINKQFRIRKNTKKKIFGLLLMIVPMMALMAIGAYPWLVFTLKQIDSVPM